MHSQYSGLSTVVEKELSFIDLFAGCGGLSLGLLKAGWQGCFAVEKSPDAFSTLRHNLISEGPNPTQGKYAYSHWPKWLGLRDWEILDILSQHYDNLRTLRGRITLLAGGPPCQGFSKAGKRSSKDARNQLFKQYLEFVKILEPPVVLIENVIGMSIPFKDSKQEKSHAEKIHKALKNDYHVEQDIVHSSRFGVPQLRPRFITIGFHKKHTPFNGSFFNLLEDQRADFLTSRNLSPTKPVSVEEAIGDITRCYGTRICKDPDSPKGKFREISYNERGLRSHYQKLMREYCSPNYQPNSLRLVNHRKETVERFKQMRKFCRSGVNLSREERERVMTHLNIEVKKHAVVFLDKNKPAHTITTLPDDLVHYKQQRIHTVREYARFQSFPDWFEFKGVFTTGGHRRKSKVPRYTQVGNAVPPLLAQAIGATIKTVVNNSRMN